MQVLNHSDVEVTEEDDDDVFGVESRGFCCFTNSIIIIYLRMWINEKPGMTGFVSRKLPEEMQIDSLNGGSAALAPQKNEGKPRSSPKTVGVLL
jgi:hypothetical protein